MTPLPKPSLGLSDCIGVHVMALGVTQQYRVHRVHKILMRDKFSMACTGSTDWVTSKQQRSAWLWKVSAFLDLIIKVSSWHVNRELRHGEKPCEN